MVEAGGVDEGFTESMTIALREFLDNLPEPPDIDALLKFYSFVLGQSDWAIPVVCFSYIENEMETLMQRAMLHHEYNDRLFTGFGPLASADAKIELAYALGWIDKKLRGDLRILKRIRNDFAHDFIEDGLEAAFVADRLREHTGVAEIKPTEKMTNGTTRALYLFAFAHTAWKVLGHLFALPTAVRVPGAYRPDIMQLDGDHRPDSLRRLDIAFLTLNRLLAFTHGNDEGQAWANEELQKYTTDEGTAILRSDPNPEEALLKYLREVGFVVEEEPREDD